MSHPLDNILVKFAKKFGGDRKVNKFIKMEDLLDDIVKKSGETKSYATLKNPEDHHQLADWLEENGKEHTANHIRKSIENFHYKNDGNGSYPYLSPHPIKESCSFGSAPAIDFSLPSKNGLHIVYRSLYENPKDVRDVFQKLKSENNDLLNKEQFAKSKKPTIQAPGYHGADMPFTTAASMAPIGGGIPPRDYSKLDLSAYNNLYASFNQAEKAIHDEAMKAPGHLEYKAILKEHNLPHLDYAGWAEKKFSPELPPNTPHDHYLNELKKEGADIVTPEMARSIVRSEKDPHQIAAVTVTPKKLTPEASAAFMNMKEDPLKATIRTANVNESYPRSVMRNHVVSEFTQMMTDPTRYNVQKLQTLGAVAPLFDNKQISDQQLYDHLQNLANAGHIDPLPQLWGNTWHKFESLHSNVPTKESIPGSYSMHGSDNPADPDKLYMRMSDHHEHDEATTYHNPKTGEHLVGMNRFMPKTHDIDEFRVPHEENVPIFRIKDKVYAVGDFFKRLPAGMIGRVAQLGRMLFKNKATVGAANPDAVKEPEPIEEPIQEPVSEPIQEEPEVRATHPPRGKEYWPAKDEQPPSPVSQEPKDLGNKNPPKIAKGLYTNVNPMLAGTKLAYHLQQIATEHPELADAVSRALKDPYNNTAFTEIGNHLKSVGSRFSDAYRWNHISKGLKIDKTVEDYVRSKIQDGSKLVKDKSGNIETLFSKLAKIHKGRIDSNTEATGTWKAFWDGLRGQVMKDAKINGIKLDKQHLDKAILNSLLRAGFRADDRREGNKVKKTKDLPQGGRIHTWEDYFSQLPGIVGRARDAGHERFSKKSPWVTSWLSPKGEFHPTKSSTGHAGFAKEMLPDVRDKEQAISKLMSQGWHRVAESGDVLHSDNYSDGKLSSIQKKAMIDHAIEHGMKKVVHYVKGKENILYDRSEKMNRGKPTKFAKLTDMAKQTYEDNEKKINQPSTHNRLSDWLEENGKDHLANFIRTATPTGNSNMVATRKLNKTRPVYAYSPNDNGQHWLGLYLPHPESETKHISYGKFVDSEDEAIKIINGLKSEGALLHPNYNGMMMTLQERRPGAIQNPEVSKRFNKSSKPTKFTNPGWPNDGSDFASASSRLKSANHLAYIDSIAKVFNQMGLKPHKITPVLHSLPDSVHPSVAAQINKMVDDPSLEYAASWLGLLAKQPSVVAYKQDPQGSDSLYHITFPLNGSDTRSELLQSGINSSVLIPSNNGTRVLIYDKGRRSRDNVGNLAVKHSVPVDEVVGAGSVLGSSNDNAKARSNYRDNMNDFEQNQQQQLDNQQK